MKKRRVVLLLGLGGFLFGCNKPIDQNINKASLEINFSHSIAGNTLQLTSATVNPFGEALTITNFQYYLSNFSLVNASGNLVNLPVEYFLVNEKVDESKTISMNIPAGVYRGIRMMIGVDSARNVSGVQSGALDPANGMFWSWNTGYIFAKLEGKSPISAAPLQNVTYHIGGFKVHQSALQFVQLNFPGAITIKEGEEIQMELDVNLDKWFDGPNPIRIANDPYCMEPGELAQRIAGNYAQMFSVISVIQ